MTRCALAGRVFAMYASGRITMELDNINYTHWLDPYSAHWALDAGRLKDELFCLTNGISHNNGVQNRWCDAKVGALRGALFARTHLSFVLKPADLIFGTRGFSMPSKNPSLLDPVVDVFMGVVEGMVLRPMAGWAGTCVGLLVGGITGKVLRKDELTTCSRARIAAEIAEEATKLYLDYQTLWAPLALAYFFSGLNALFKMTLILPAAVVGAGIGLLRGPAMGVSPSNAVDSLPTMRAVAPSGEPRIDDTVAKSFSTSVAQKPNPKASEDFVDEAKTYFAHIAAALSASGTDGQATRCRALDSIDVLSSTQATQEQQAYFDLAGLRSGPSLRQELLAARTNRYAAWMWANYFGAASVRLEASSMLKTVRSLPHTRDFGLLVQHTARYFAHCRDVNQTLLRTRFDPWLTWRPPLPARWNLNLDVHTLDLTPPQILPIDKQNLSSLPLVT